MTLKLLNLGCGGHFHPDWTNLDLDPAPGVQAHNVYDRLPFPKETFDAVYHSDLLEHLSKSYVPLFLLDCWRVLKPGGVLRVAVPDLEVICENYLESLHGTLEGNPELAARYDWTVIELIDQLTRHVSGGEMIKYWHQNPMPAESFVVERVGADIIRAHRRSPGVPLEPSRPSSAELDPLAVGEFRLGGQVHLWMYDRYSLGNLLKQAGFCEIKPCKFSESEIPNFAFYGLDIAPDDKSRKPDSLFMEAKK